VIEVIVFKVIFFPNMRRLQLYTTQYSTISSKNELFPGGNFQIGILASVLHISVFSPSLRRVDAFFKSIEEESQCVNLI